MKNESSDHNRIENPPSVPDSTQTDGDAPKPDTKIRNPRHCGGRVGTLLGILNFILILALATAGYWAWDRQSQGRLAMQKQAADQLNAGLRGLSRETGRLEAGLSERLDTLNRRQKHLSDRQNDLQADLDQIRVFSVRGTAGWALAEVEYLLRIANHRLQLQHDPKVALIALDTADQRLRTLADPALTPVRQRLAREITALKNLPDPDLQGLALRLESLAEQVAHLPLPDTMLHGEQTAEDSAEQSTTRPPDTDEPRRVANVIWTNLKGLVRLKTHDKPVQALLSPKERFFLYQNLRLRLNSARLHLLERNPSALRSDLSQARQLLDTYFDPADPKVRGSIKTLRDIAKVNVAPPLPDISGSLAALRHVMAELAKQRLSPASATEIAQ